MGARQDGPEELDERISARKCDVSPDSDSSTEWDEELELLEAALAPVKETTERARRKVLSHMAMEWPPLEQWGLDGDIEFPRRNRSIRIRRTAYAVAATVALIVIGIGIGMALNDGAGNLMVVESVDGAAWPVSRAEMLGWNPSSELTPAPLAENSEPTPLQTGAKLNPNIGLAVGQDSSALVRLGDRGHVRLEDSALFLAVGPGAMHQKSGRGEYVIRAVGNDESVFAATIRVPTGYVRARQAQFTIEASPEEVVVRIHQGSVRCEPRQGEPTDFEADRVVELTIDTAAAQKPEM